jgi:hypothetical protein
MSQERNFTKEYFEASQSLEEAVKTMPRDDRKQSAIEAFEDYLIKTSFSVIPKEQLMEGIVKIRCLIYSLDTMSAEELVKRIRELAMLGSVNKETGEPLGQRI